MSDQRTAPTATDAIASSVPDLTRLHRTVQGWLDGDLLLAEEGDPLLAAIAAARRARDAGDREEMHRHTSRLVLAMETLLQSGAIDEAHVGATLALVRQL